MKGLVKPMNPPDPSNYTDPFNLWLITCHGIKQRLFTKWTGCWSVGWSDAAGNRRAARLHLSDWDPSVSDWWDTGSTCCQPHWEVCRRAARDDARELAVRLRRWRFVLLFDWYTRLSQSVMS